MTSTAVLAYITGLLIGAVALHICSKWRRAILHFIGRVKQNESDIVALYDRIDGAETSIVRLESKEDGLVTVWSDEIEEDE